MTNQGFIDSAKTLVREYTLKHLKIEDDVVPEFSVHLTWDCYILGNMKALLCTSLNDGMYYEVTYNRAAKELYLDAYKKQENIVFP